MADFEMKKTAIQLLAINGILTQAEVDKCIKAISSDDCDVEHNEEVVARSSSISSNCVYEDSNLCVIFKSISSISNLFFGDGIEFKFIIQNKTNYDIRVNATEITINGFVVSNSELICSEATPMKKTIDNFNLYSGALNDVDVSSPDDIYELELAISYEIEELDIEREGNAVEIDL